MPNIFLFKEMQFYILSINIVKPFIECNYRKNFPKREILIDLSIEKQRRQGAVPQPGIIQL